MQASMEYAVEARPCDGDFNNSLVTLHAYLPKAA